MSMDYCTNNRNRVTHPKARRVLMNFMLCNGWSCHFLEADARTGIGTPNKPPSKARYYNTTPERILELRERYGLPRVPEKNDVEHNLSIGRGSVWLDLPEEEYQKLRR
ncbi:hypothetical protein [Terriglobus sp. ADX1]|uniref:hypothetical protein n=1 Tax=Terriglobus sp. ADX1 TaxID=2794063 RepID=UPI002FE54F11